jgi:UDP-glucose 4-epimerase
MSQPDGSPSTQHSTLGNSPGRVLVTGGLGAIGSYVVRALAAAGARPVAFSTRGDTRLVTDLRDRIDVVAGDVLDLPHLLRTLREFDCTRIVHLAALVVPTSQANPLRAVKVNVEGALHVFEAARVLDLRRVVYLSTKGVLGEITGDAAHPTYRPLDEDEPPRPADVYSVTKLTVEQLADHYARDHGLDVVGLRLSTTYGPGKGERHGFAATLTRMVEAAARGAPVHLPRGGEQRDDMVYHADVAQGILRALEVERLEHRLFHLGSGDAMSYAEFAAAVCGAVPGADVSVGPGLDPFGRRTYCLLDIRRAQRELGYAPQFPPDRAIPDYLATIRAIGWTGENA